MATSSLFPCVTLTGGKRGAPGPLIVTTSDEDSSDGEPLQQSPGAHVFTRISPRANVTDMYPSLKLDLSRTFSEFKSDRDRAELFRLDWTTEMKTQSTAVQALSTLPDSAHAHQQACEGYEHDHDYENVASPSGSSTASGPVYVRPPGFKHHAHEIRRKKKKPSGLLDRREGIKSRAPTPPKVRPKREPLPMRLRALPQSFWKQPNNPIAISPGNIFSSLPPLSSTKDDDVSDIRPITPPEERKKNEKKAPERKLIVTGDTDFLFKRLFADVMEEKMSTTSNNPSHLKRGRPPKKMMLPCKPIAKGLLSGDDPYLLDCSLTQKLFPQLSIESNSRQGHNANPSLQLITFREGDKSVTLPSLSIEQNYSQILSELVMNI